MSHRKSTRIRVTCLALAMSLLTAWVAVAGEHPASASQSRVSKAAVTQHRVAAEEKAFGTLDSTIAVIPASAFAPAHDEASGQSVEFTIDSQGWVAKTGGTVNFIDFVGPVSLPAGADIQTMHLEVCDDSTSGQVTLLLNKCPIASDGSCATQGTIESGQSATPGCAIFGLSIDEIINNFLYRYNLLVVDTDDTTDTRFRSVEIHWKRQVSPAPGSATFGDVPTSHPFFRHVEALADSGITAGCGGGDFCPDATLTRGQMAVFLSKALGLHWPD